MNKIIDEILKSRKSNEEKRRLLENITDEIDFAMEFLNGKYKYCDECKEYYLTKSFFSNKEETDCKICVYEDPINSGGNDYVDGRMTTVYEICPKGHRKIVDQTEQRK